MIMYESYLLVCRSLLNDNYVMLCLSPRFDRARRCGLEQKRRLSVCVNSFGLRMTPQSFPIKTKLFQRTLDGVPTDFSFSTYADQTVLFITQIGTAGTIIMASQDAAFDGSTTYSTSVLLGRRDEAAALLQLCCRQIVEAAGAAGYKKPMIIGLGLKIHSMEMVRQIMQAVTSDNTWSISLAPS